MKNLFVPYELALSAKQKGFNERCLAEYYHNIEGTRLMDMPEDSRVFYVSENLETIKPENCSAPLYQQLVDWFREKHNIIVYVLPQDKGWVPSYYPEGKYTERKSVNLDATYYEALTEAITKAFELIEAKSPA